MNNIFLGCILLLVSLFLPLSAVSQTSWTETEEAPPTYAISGESVDVSQLDFKLSLKKLKNPHLTPESKWSSRHSAIHRSAAAQLKGDVLLLPVQVQALGYSRELRQYFSLQLQRIFDQAGYELVANQALLAQAFQTDRQIPMSEATSLADATAARMIVETFVGHYPTSRSTRDMVVTMRVWERTESGGWVSSARVSPVFDAERAQLPVTELFNTFIPEIQKWFAPERNWDAKNDAARRVKVRQFHFGQTEFKKPIDQAIFLQLLGSLTPRVSERTRRDYFTRSLVILDNTGGLHPDYQHLKARATNEMMGRYALRQELKDSGNAADSCFFTYLESNLTGHRECAAQHKHPAIRFINVMETLRMAVAFGRDDVEEEIVDLAVKLSEEVGDGWLPATLAFAKTMDLWQRTDSEWVKRELDQRYPLENYTLATVKSKSLLRGDVASQLRIAPIKHYRLLLAQTPADKLLAGYGQGVSDFDHLAFLTAHSIDALLKPAERMIDLQVLPARAAEYLREWNVEMDGHAYFTALQAKALNAESLDVDEGKASHLRSQAFEMGSRAYIWSQGVSLASTIGSTAAHHSAVKSGNKERVPHIWERDLPQSSQYKRNFYEHEYYWFHQKAKRKLGSNEPLGEIEDQFNGYPPKDTLLLTLTNDRGDWEEAAVIAKRVMKQKPENFTPYKILAKQHQREGKFDEAASVLRKFPEFVEASGKDRVVNSHRAGGAGSDFLWGGRADLADEFFRITAEIGSGSGSDLHAIMRIAQAENDLQTMANMARYRAQRYPDSVTLRDYLGLLVNLGHAEEVLDLFDEIYSQYKDIRTWVPAMTAQRALGYSEQQVVDWLNRKSFTGDYKHDEFRIQQLMRSLTTDRIPSMQAVELMAVTDGLYLQHNDGTLISSRFLSRPYVEHEVDMSTAKVGDAFTYTSYEYVGVGHFVESRSKKIVLANRLAKLEDFAAAEKILDQLDAEKRLIGERYTLPLYAYVKGRLGKLDDVRGQLEKFTPRSRDVEHELALVLLEGFSGNEEQALYHIDRTFGFSAGNTDTPMFRTFAIAQTLYWLWQSTGVESYREKALSWAKNSQIVEYYLAWPYALEAVLTTNKKDQLRAAKKALYLDPQSQFMKEVPELVIEQAKAVLHAGENPHIELPERAQKLNS